MNLNDLMAAERTRRGLDNTTPPAAPRTSGALALVRSDDPRAGEWISKALRGKAEGLAQMGQDTGRNAALNAAAYALGRFAPHWLAPDDIRQVLLEACQQNGLIVEDGLKACEDSLNSGLRAGMDVPRDPPLRDNTLGGFSDLVAGPVAVTLGGRRQQVDPATGELVDVEPDAPALDPDAEDAALRLLIRERVKPLDWHELWADDSEEEWIVEPILPARRLVALYSAPKVGKSLLMLELAASVARGVSVLGMTPDRPRRVLYIDFENDPKADVRERLQAMGLRPDDLGGLCYLSYPTLAALDSDRGGKELLAAVREYACEVVVVDTVSRSIAGEENENDTWLSFYRHTGLRLKQEGVALIRLDHSGKDETKGQRGGSAKSGDVDAVWRMSRVTDDTYRLDCEAARMPVTERTLVLHRKQGPLRHTVDAEGRKAAWDAKVKAIVKALDEAAAPLDMGGKKARELIRGAGLKAGNDVIAEAVRRRSQGVPEWRGHPDSEQVSP